MKAYKKAINPILFPNLTKLSNKTHLLLKVSPI